MRKFFQRLKGKLKQLALLSLGLFVLLFLDRELNDHLITVLIGIPLFSVVIFFGILQKVRTFGFPITPIEWIIQKIMTALGKPIDETDQWGWLNFYGSIVLRVIGFVLLGFLNYAFIVLIFGA